MNTLKKVGVLGGMGPEATVLLMQRVIAFTDAHDDQDHVPMLVNMNPQVPSRLAALLGDGDVSPVPSLMAMAKDLESQGAAALVMPCNTAHHYASEFMETIEIPLLNMIELAAERISKLKIERCQVGMLASPATDKFDIFQDVFDRYGLKAVFPENSAKALSIIKRIKSEGIYSDLTDNLAEFVTELETRGADCFLVGCSEFSLLTQTLSPSLPIFDSVDLLAEAIVTFSGAKQKTRDDGPRFT